MKLSHSISYTGIPDNSYITSKNDKGANGGTIIKIKIFGNLNIIHKSPESIQNLYKELRLHPDLKKYTDSQLDEYINIHKNINKVYLSDKLGIKIMVKFIKISGSGFLSKLTETQINYLLSGNPNDSEGYFDIIDVYNMIPRKPNSKAARHTLIFRPSIWVLYIPNNDNSINSITNKLCYDFEKCLICDNLYAESGYNIVKIPLSNNLVHYNEMYIKHKKNNDKLDINIIFKLLNVKYNFEINVINIIYEKIKWFTPSIHKSLIQKIIRTGAKNIIIEDITYNADLILSISIIMLYLHPGSFVHNIQKFVKGSESLTKRLAVSITEDSYTEYTNVMSQLLILSIMIRYNIEYEITEDILFNWINLAILSKNDNRIFNYDTHLLDNKINIINYYKFNYILMTELRSFDTDINMFSTIDGKYAHNVNKTKIDTIYLEHCLDHHCLPEIGYFYNNDDGIAYDVIYKYIFQYKTGLNPRKLTQEKLMDIIKTNIYSKIKNAQKLLYLSKIFIPINYNYVDNHYIFNYKLDDAYLAGLIGCINIKYNDTNYIFTLRSNDIYSYNVMRKPNRDDKTDTIITQEEKEIVIKIGKNILIKGYNIMIPNYLQICDKATIYLINADNNLEYYVNYLDNMIPWDEFKNLSKKIEYVESKEFSIENSIKYIGDGIQINYEENIMKLFNNYNINVLLRLNHYLSGYKSKINMHKFNKKGVGQDYTIFVEDGKVFEILSYLCVIIPAAISKHDTISFNIKYGPLIWYVHDKLKILINNINFNNFNNENKWNIPSNIKNRLLYEHQLDSVNKMIENKNKNKCVNLIHIPPGMGKTYIILMYIKWLIENKKMPMYCVYTLPPSASETIINECKMMGYSYEYLDFTKNGNKEIKPYIINIIKHDHLRLNIDELLNKSTNMLFIVDELHKTLNKTIRTSVALNIAENSSDVIGLSGTIIKDNDVDILIPWLSLYSEYEINTNNYWVAIGSMISKKVYTNVNIIRHNYNIDMNDNEEYNKLLHNNKFINNICFQKGIKLCYDICYNEMINKCIEYVNKGEYIFMIAKNIEIQELFEKMLINKGINKNNIYLIGKNNSIDYKNNDTREYKVIITTLNYSEGYNITKCRILITCTYFSNQATREQLEYRINRIGQEYKQIEIITYTAGILYNINERYNETRKLSLAIKDFADNININDII